jgi:hypothetical protein
MVDSADQGDGMEPGGATDPADSGEHGNDAGGSQASAGGDSAGENGGNGGGVPPGPAGEDGVTRTGGTGAGGSGGPAELLGEVRTLRRRARLARHAYWFPLVLFGLLTCASVPFYIGRFPFAGRATYFRLPGPVFLRSAYLGGFGRLAILEGGAYYWLGAMLLGITATALWYRWRGNRVGLRTPARGYLISALVLVALALLIPVLSGGSTTPIMWPFDYVVSNLFPLVLIGLGLCVLAWAERSTGLAVIAATFLALSIVANLYFLSNVLARLHWYLSPAVGTLPNVLMPALVLLLSGAGAWVVQRRQHAPAPED